MDEEVKKHLEASGWKVGDVQDFLQLTDEEMAEVERRVAERKKQAEKTTDAQSKSG